MEDFLEGILGFDRQKMFLCLQGVTLAEMCVQNCHVYAIRHERVVTIVFVTATYLF